VSPDGRYVAFQTQHAEFTADTYRTEWYVCAIRPDATPVPVGSGGDLILTPSAFGRIDGARADIRAEWSPDGRWIAYLRKDGDQVQVWRSRADGSGSQQVTHGGANVLAFAWRPDGRAIYFEVGRSRGAMAEQDRLEGERGYLIDDRFMPVYSTRPLWLACGRQMWNVPVVRSERCTPRLWIEIFGSPQRVATAAEARAYRRLATIRRPPSVGESRLISRVVWSGSGARAAWLENLSPRTERGSAAPLTLFADGHRCPVAACSGQLRGVWWQGTRVVFLRREGWAYSVPALYVWNPHNAALRRVYRSDSTLRSCAMGVDRLVCLRETPSSPRSIVAIGLSDGRLETVFDPNPRFSRYRLGRIEKLDVTDGMGHEAFGHLVYPPDFQAGCRYPLVIVQYRSQGFLDGGTGNEYPIFPLAAAGFLVYSSDNPVLWRLLARYDTSRWQDLAAFTAREIGPSAYRERSALRVFAAVIDLLTRRGVVDPSRVGITGLSAGAEVLYYALIHSRRYAAAVTSGLASPELGDLEVNRTARALFEVSLGARTLSEAIRTSERLFSLPHNLGRVNTPLLMQLADHELIWDLPAYVALRNAGKPVEAYVYPDEHHIKWRPLHKLAVGVRTIDWFRFWLQGEEDPSPAKTPQYARWRALRRESQYGSLAARRWSCSQGAVPSSDPNLGGDTREEAR
jgi:dipeptidyl aminopeptidase/acylaminoacyl peptidase